MAIKNFRHSPEFQKELEEARGSRLLTLGDLFFPMPSSWGLRGDPYLWSALAAQMNYERLEDECDSEPSFENHIKALFHELTGADIDKASTDPTVPMFAHGGMSSGMVSLNWWRGTGIPLLLRRHQNLIEKN
ncbi:hypothetical protein AB9K35_18155 [Leisingera sp. XS_AS12]|uniref:hypothetical protein n=1 Tax=Leisingera sp. XS_AS12 TaxID=3241294 RepID=UPI0035174178